MSLQKHLQKKEIETLETRTKEAEAKAVVREMQLVNTKDTLNVMVKMHHDIQLKNQLLNKLSSTMTTHPLSQLTK